jgi:hypothetical protein
MFRIVLALATLLLGIPAWATTPLKDRLNRLETSCMQRDWAATSCDFQAKAPDGFRKRSYADLAAFGELSRYVFVDGLGSLIETGIRRTQPAYGYFDAKKFALDQVDEKLKTFADNHRLSDCQRA